MLAFSLSGAIATELFAFLLMNRDLDDTLLRQLFQTGGSLITLLVAFPVFLLVLKAWRLLRPVRWKPETKLSVPQHFIFILLALIPTILLLAAETFLYLRGSLPLDSVVTTNAPDLISRLLFNCLLFPFMEEIMFRGILLNCFRAHGTRFAVILSTLFFAIGHGNPMNMLNAILPGLAFACAAVKSKGICYGIFYHILVNLLSNIFLPLLLFRIILQ